jgi:hypothetical protein
MTRRLVIECDACGATWSDCFGDPGSYDNAWFYIHVIETDEKYAPVTMRDACSVDCLRVIFETVNKVLETRLLRS